jgi:HD superfamily phosphohydrolase
MKATRPKRVDFYDPLYDYVTFEEAAQDQPRRGFIKAFNNIHKRGNLPRTSADTHGDSISGSEDKVILPFLSSIEFVRQSFLRQSNLTFLVHPSATHTRLAHSIGACYLGFIAAQRVAVAVEPIPKYRASIAGNGERRTGNVWNPEYLSSFLERTGLREEFLLALLLHDVGHFPFSHALENNREFWEAFGDEVRHEEAACQLIRGEGPVYEASVRRVEEVGWKGKKDHPHLAELFANSCPSIEKDVICYLISSHSEYIEDKKPRPTDDRDVKRTKTKLFAELRVVHELVSGLLDLDRIDHYRRDNLFTGLRVGTSLNFPSLLSGLTMCYDIKDIKREPSIRLSPSAIGQAISLLQSKERLTEDCFEHPDNVAYEAMLHHAFNMYVLGPDFFELEDGGAFPEEKKQLVYDLLVSTDEQLLFRMSQNGHARVKDVVFRIMHRAPYSPVARLRLPPKHNRTVREIRDEIAQRSRIKKTDIVLRVQKGFGGKKDGVTGEWLRLDRLQNSEGDSLIDGKYARQIKHFKEAQEDKTDLLWVYTTSDNNRDRLNKILRDICHEWECESEDL